MIVDVPTVREALTRIEDGLDPARPEGSGLTVLAYGEISATLLLPDPALAGVVGKRMSGFPDEASAQDYAALVTRYCEVLRAEGLTVVETQPVVVPRRHRPPVVYLVQPLLPAETLGNRLLQTASAADVARLVTLALAQADLALASRQDGLRAAIDAQLSNFSFADGTATLLDVGTPFLRRAGHDLLDMRVMLAAVPPGIRAVYLWRRIGERYIDDYYDRRLVAVDLLGNFIKEGAEGRISTGLAAANAWLDDPSPITRPEVEQYYRKDVGTLELFLRVRRTDRWIRTRLLRKPYDFVLPGPVAR
jgi:hypothetical protein